MSNRPTSRQRKAVVERAQGFCEYCRIPVAFAVQSFECEHIIPQSQGGRTVLDNLALSCGGCNRIEAVRTVGVDPDSGEQVALFHPRKQRWRDHFAWSDDFTEIIGLTAAGRATAYALRLNRQGLVNLRRVLLKAGEHPPADR